MKCLLVSVLLIIFTGCASVEKEYPTNITTEEVTAAILAFRESNNNILFLHIVDREGKVVRSELVDKKGVRLDHQALNRIQYYLQRNMVYPPAKENEAEYRHKFNAVKHKESTSFG